MHSIIRLVLGLILVFMSYQSYAAGTINLYTEPAKTSKIVASVPQEQALVPIIQQKDWIKVGNPKNGDVGWVQQTDLTQNVSGINLQTPLVRQYIVTEKNKDGKPISKLYRMVEYSSSQQQQPMDEKQMQTYMDKLAAQQKAMQENFNKMQDNLNKMMNDMMKNFSN